MKMSRVVIFRLEGKLRAIVAKTETVLEKIGLFVLDSRVKIGMFEQPESPTLLDFKSSDLKKIPFESVKDLAKEALRSYTLKERVYEEKKEKFQKVISIVREKDGVSCLEFLELNKRKEGHEFEIYEIQELTG